MNEQKRDELLYRVDERTDRIEKEHMRRLKEIEGDVAKNSKALEEHGKRIQRNETLLGAITFGLGSIITAGAAKIGGLLHFLRGVF